MTTNDHLMTHFEKSGSPILGFRFFQNEFIIRY